MDKEGMRWYTLKKRTEEPYVSEDEKGGAPVHVAEFRGRLLNIAGEFAKAVRCKVESEAVHGSIPP